MDIRIRVIFVGKDLGWFQVYLEDDFFIWSQSPKFIPFVNIHQDVYAPHNFVICVLNLLYFNKKFTWEKEYLRNVIFSYVEF